MQNEVAAVGWATVAYKSSNDKSSSKMEKSQIGNLFLVALNSKTFKPQRTLCHQKKHFSKGFFQVNNTSLFSWDSRGRSPPKIIDMRKSVRNTNRQMDCERCIGMQQIRSSHHQKEGSDNLDNMIKVEEIKGNHKFLLIRCSEFRYQCAF